MSLLLFRYIMSATLNGKPLVDRSSMGKPRNYQDQILWSRELSKEIKESFWKLKNDSKRFEIFVWSFWNFFLAIYWTVKLLVEIKILFWKRNKNGKMKLINIFVRIFREDLVVWGKVTKHNVNPLFFSTSSIQIVYLWTCEFVFYLKIVFLTLSGNHGP